MKKRGWLLYLLSAVFIAGCGENAFESMADKNSDAAKQEEAQILIDSGDYGSAITLLQEKCPNNVCTNADDAQQLASAYMGNAGLDVLNIIKQAEELSTSTTNGSDYATISTLLPTISQENLTNISSAVSVLSNIPLQSRTEDQKLQLAIAEVSATIIAIGQVTIGGQSGYDTTTGIPISCGTECDSTDVSNIMTSTITTSTGSTTVADYVATSISDAAVNIAATSLTDADTAKQINDLITNIQSSTTTSCSNSSTGATPMNTAVTDTQVQNYLTACM